MRVLSSNHAPGLPFTSSTIAAMHALVRLAVLDPRVSTAAKEILKDVPRRDYRAEAAALLRWTQQNARYTRDPQLPDGIDRVSHPLVTLASGGEDCDGLATLLASLAASVGFEYAFRTIGDNAAAPDEFRHVYVMLHVPNVGWVAADPSFEQPLGWEPSPDRVELLPDGTTVAAAPVVRDWHP